MREIAAMVGARMKARRLEAGLSQEELSERTGIKRAHLSDLEHDKIDISRMRLGTFYKLCRVLDIEPYELISEDDLAQQSF